MAAKRRLLTDRFLRSLPPAPRGQRVEVYDARLPCFGIRISDAKDADPARRGKAGKITFILYARFAPGAAPARRSIGIYGANAMRLEDARRVAGEWRSQSARGIDPAVIEAERRAAEARERALRVKHSFTIAAEAFIAAKLEKERSGKVAERDLRSVFIAAWGERPVSEITKSDVLEIIITKRNTAPQMARALLVLIKRFFGWVVDQEIYGLSTSPCEGLSGKKLIGELQSRDRRLSDIELFAFWRATGRMGYPAGSVYRMLLLTGLRLNEAAQISWPEVQGNIIVIPASRMKGREGKAREHLVPLSSAAQEIIASLPRIKNGPFLFSLSAGKRPLAVTGPVKRDLDRRMLRTLKAMARRRGEDHHAVDLPHWTNHDLRRVVRSGLSALRVQHDVAEAILAHAPPPASSAPTIFMNTRTRSARHWRSGRSGSQPSSARLPRCLTKRSSPCGSGGDDGPAGCGAWPPVRWRKGGPPASRSPAGAAPALPACPVPVCCAGVRSLIPIKDGPSVLPLNAEVDQGSKPMEKAQLRKALEILPSEPVPAGQYLVHNDMTPTKPLGLGLHGFRAWIQTKADNLVPCHCNFGGCKNSKLHKLHYRVDRRTFDPPEARP